MNFSMEFQEFLREQLVGLREQFVMDNYRAFHPVEIPQGENTQAWVYTYTCTDQPVYIGRTENPWQRAQQHWRKSGWWHFADGVSYVPFDSVKESRIAEIEWQKRSEVFTCTHSSVAERKLLERDCDSPVLRFWKKFPSMGSFNFTFVWMEERLDSLPGSFFVSDEEFSASYKECIKDITGQEAYV